MNLKLSFIILFLSSQLYLDAQSGLPKVAYTSSGNEDIAWTETDKISYYLSDNFELAQLTPFDQIGFNSKVRKRKYKCKWQDGKFISFSVLNLTPLQNGAYYSNEPTWQEYNKNGTVNFISESGSLIKTSNSGYIPNIKNWESIDPRVISPLLEVPLNFSFVPYLNMSEINELKRQGYRIIYEYPNRLDVSIDSTRMIIDNHTKTKKIIYGLGTSVRCIETDHYIIDSNTCFKYKTIIQDFYKNYKDICYMQVTERRYSDYSNLNRPIFPRSAEPSNEIIADIEVYPNPNNGEFIVKYNNIQGKNSVNSISLIDMHGNNIPISKSPISNSEIKIKLDDDNRSSAYILNFKVNNQVISHKILKF